jgi:hypothetical protein
MTKGESRQGPRRPIDRLTADGAIVSSLATVLPLVLVIVFVLLLVLPLALGLRASHGKLGTGGTSLASNGFGRTTS